MCYGDTPLAWKNKEKTSVDYLYFGLVIVLAIAFSIYTNKRNKTKESVYQTDTFSNNSSQDNSLEDDVDFEESDETEQDSFSSYKFDILFYWITQKVKQNSNINYDKLREKIVKTFGELPDILEDDTTYLNTESEKFLKEVLGRIEYSSVVKYLFVTKNRKIVSFLSILFSIIGIVFFVKFQIAIRQVETNNTDLLYLLLTIVSFIFSSLCKKIAERIFNYMICTMKPGDYLRIINSKDEIIEKEVKINQLSRNETKFNKTTIFQSRNQLLCESFIEKSQNMLNTINNKLCLYLVLNYLKTRYSKEAYREYLLEKEIDTLEYIAAFNPKSVSANYELSMRYLESKRYEDFYERLLKCRNINGYDWIIEAGIISYEFCNENIC